MLKISAQSEYALLVVKFLKESWDSVKIREISYKLGISEPMLRKISNKLERAWILKSIKWRNWWVELARTDLSVYDVISSVWEDLHVAMCAWKVCDKNSTCRISPIVASLQKWLEAVLRVTKI